MNLARILALAAVAAAGTAPAQTWVIADGEHGSQVTFTSKAPMETFQGRTHDVTGTVAIARGDADTLRVAAVVAMATLDTGIALRNRHMRENHLETDRFPEGRFEGEGTLAPAADGARTVTLHGTLTLHGVARRWTSRRPWRPTKPACR